MPDVAAYPLLRPRRRRRRWRLPRLAPARLRPAAVLLVAVALIAGLLWLSRRPHAPDAAAALRDAGTTLRAGNYHAARRHAEIAAAADPRSGEAQLMLAQAFLMMRNGVAAEAALDRAEALGVAAARLRTRRGEALVQQGDPGGALAAIDGLTGGEADRVRALALAAQGQGAAAQALLARRVAAVPHDARAWTALGRLRLDAGEMGGAADAAATAVRVAPGEPAALTLQGEVVRARFGLIAALPWFEAALRRDAYDHAALIEYAATLGDVGRYADALAATRRALLAEPGSPPALYLQAVIAMRADRPELARKLIAAAGRALDGVPGAVLLAGAADAATGRWEEAATRWRRLVAMQPMNLAARRLLAGAQLRTRDRAGALETLRPIALRADADAYALRLAARGWEAAGAPAAATSLLDRAAGGGRADGLFATDDNDAALTASAAAAPADPTYALGVIRGLAAAGDRVGALAKARALAAAAPRDPAALLALGDTLAVSGRRAEALAAYLGAADLQFDEPTMLRLVDALGRADRPADAAATLALYLGQNPQSLVARRLLGRWQVAAGRWAEAIETLEGVRAQLGNRDAGLLADLALAYAGDGEGDAARLYGRTAYALAPMRAAVADAYAAALAAAGERRGARQLADKAVALAPGNPAYLARRRALG